VPAPAISRRYIGTNASVTDSRDIAIQKVKESSMNAYRDAVYWAWVEQQRGVYSIDSNLNPVRGVDLALQNGVEPLIVLAYHNDLYPDISEPANGMTRTAFANYAAYVASYFGSKVKMYEVWNEWNGGIFQGCAYTDPCASAVTYADLLCKTYQKLKAVDPNLIVVGGAVSAASIWWIQTLLDSGGGACMDVLSVHPYTYRYMQDWGVPTNASAAADAMMVNLQDVHTMLQNKAGRDIPIFITEEGLPSSTLSEEQDAANYLTMVVTRAKSYPFIQGLWWYNLRNTNTSSWGMLYADWTPKKPYIAMQQVAPGW
jgi:hypothetical protein